MPFFIAYGQKQAKRTSDTAILTITNNQFNPFAQ